MTSPIREVQTFAAVPPPGRRRAVPFGVVGTLLILLFSATRVKKWDLVAVAEVACLVGLIWLVALPADWVLYALSGRKARLQVGPDGLYREQGGPGQSVPWGAISRVQIESGHDGELVRVDVYTPEGRALELHEFERLPEIAELVRRGVAPGIPVECVEAEDLAS